MCWGHAALLQMLGWCQAMCLNRARQQRRHRRALQDLSHLASHAGVADDWEGLREWLLLQGVLKSSANPEEALGVGYRRCFLDRLLPGRRSASACYRMHSAPQPQLWYTQWLPCPSSGLRPEPLVAQASSAKIVLQSILCMLRRADCFCHLASPVCSMSISVITPQRGECCPAPATQHSQWPALLCWQGYCGR